MRQICVWLVALSTACGEESLIPTDALLVTVSATQTDDAMFSVRAEFRVADFDPCLPLASDDIVEAAPAGDAATALTPEVECDDGGPAYVGVLAGDPDAGAVVLSLERRTGERVESMVVLPPAFTPQTAGDTFSRAEQIAIAWPPSPEVEAVFITAEGSCLVAGFAISPEADVGAGQLVIPGGAIRARSDVGPDATCPLVVQLSLLHRAGVSATFAGGDADGRRVRTLTLTSTP